MLKKSQVTIFIVIGVVLVVAVGFGYVFLSANEKERRVTEVNSDDPINFFVKNCFEGIVLDAVEKVSIQGGYFEVPESHTGYLWYNVPHYFDYDKGKSIPTIEEIEQQFGLYVEKKIGYCTDNFNVFKDQGYKVVFKGVNADAKISENSIGFDLDYDIEIEKDGSVTKISKFFKSVEVDFMKSYSMAMQLINKQAEDPAFVKLGYLVNLAYENGVVTNTLYTDNSVVYLIFNNKTLLNGEPYVFGFGIGYDWESVEKVENGKEEVRITGLEAYPGYEFIYKLEYTGDYTDYTDLFDISDEGNIQFTPEEDDAGKHEILIIVEEENASKYITLELDIISENNLPVIDEIPKQIVNLTESPIFDLTVKAEDPDDETIIYNIDSPIKGMEINAITGKIYHNMDEAYPSIYSIIVKATDTKGGTSRRVFELEVKNE